MKNENFRNFLKNYAVHRKTFAEELAKRCPESATPVAEVSAVTCKRLENRLKSANGEPSEIKDKAILRACGMGEDSAIAAYESALGRRDLSEETAKILHRHRNHLLAARRILSDLAAIIHNRAGRNLSG